MTSHHTIQTIYGLAFGLALIVIAWRLLMIAGALS